MMEDSVSPQYPDGPVLSLKTITSVFRSMAYALLFMIASILSITAIALGGDLRWDIYPWWLHRLAAIVGLLFSTIGIVHWKNESNTDRYVTIYRCTAIACCVFAFILLWLLQQENFQRNFQQQFPVRGCGGFGVLPGCL